MFESPLHYTRPEAEIVAGQAEAIAAASVAVNGDDQGFDEGFDAHLMDTFDGRLWLDSPEAIHKAAYKPEVQEQLGVQP